MPTAERPRSLLRRWWFDIPLWQRILAALVLGAVLGFFWGEGVTQIKWIGDIFVRLIRMLVVPLVFVTIVAGMSAMGDITRLGSIGGKTLALYLFTTLLSACLGLFIGGLLKPGVGVDLAGVVPQVMATGSTSLAEQFISIVPTNPIASLAQGEILSVIFFALLLGAGILAVGDAARPVVSLFDAGSQILLKVTHFVMETAPFGVLALIAWVMGTSGPSAFFHVFILAVCVLIGCTVQILFIHGGVVRLLARLPVLPFFHGIIDVVVVAFSTSSSAATLPVSMRVAVRNLGVSPIVASTALPIGTTVSMDGTAMYVGLLTMFAAQIFGVSLDLGQFVAVILVTTLVAVGSAPIPSASLFLLAGVLQVIGVTAEQTALIVGFILPFDRILDMMRTVPNCTGDLAVAVTVARAEEELDRGVYMDLSDE
nr:dicarboxylate/amino acid:cation symporter [uncultured Brevundimonas sp.]